MINKYIGIYFASSDMTLCVLCAFRKYHNFVGKTNLHLRTSAIILPTFDPAYNYLRWANAIARKSKIRGNFFSRKLINMLVRFLVQC